MRGLCFHHHCFGQRELSGELPFFDRLAIAMRIIFSVNTHFFVNPILKLS